MSITWLHEEEENDGQKTHTDAEYLAKEVKLEIKFVCF